MKSYVAMWHIASMSVGLVMSTIQTARILKTGRQIKWTSIFGGFSVMLLSIALTVWNKESALKELRK